MRARSTFLVCRMHRFRKLELWKRIRAATIRVYRVSKGFPLDERFGITSQLRRAAISVGANLAEGSKRATNRDFAHFVNISEGSAAEVWYLLDIIPDLELPGEDEVRALAQEFQEIEKMLYSLRKHLTRPENV